MHFQTKNILKSNYDHNLKHYLNRVKLDSI